MYNLDTPIWQLTVADFIDLNKKIMAEATQPPAKDFTEKRYVYGLAGLMAALNCSKSKAHEIKKSGKIDAAISQHGRKIIIDADKAISLLKTKAL
ncbi:DUF3853 family protein [Niabella aurantiaca]|uniref:DUF3853 family protein n=1 Tax=Niabella aurantiaca TaxID=379900 RepID=UPI0003628CC6|nr:DUF3853 family protein [Niabella aurantiaca]